MYNVIILESILVVDQNGKLRRIYCPFPVIALKSIKYLEEGKQYRVKSVKWIRGETVYLYTIGKDDYYYSNFAIVVE